MDERPKRRYYLTNGAGYFFTFSCCICPNICEQEYSDFNTPDHVIKAPKGWLQFPDLGRYICDICVVRIKNAEVR